MKETKTLSLKIEDLKSIIRSLLIATIAIVLAMTMVPIQALAANTETINREPDVTSSINDQMESSKNDSTSIEPIIASKSVFDTSSPLAASPLSSPWESEPNDKESEANIISIGATYTGRFGSNGSSDYDYYRFYIPSTSKVTIDFTGEKGYDGAFIAGLYLYSNQIDYSASWSTYRKTPGATPTRTSNLFLPKGTYFLRVYADNGDKSWGQTYNFRITNAASNAIESETNGTESDADPISLGKYYTGSTYIPGRGSDYDYYRFYIPSTSKVTIDFTGEKGYDGAFIAGLYLYSNQIDYSASWSTYRKTPGAAPTRTSNLFLPKGTYFLRVYAESDDSSWGQTYTLRITNAQSSAIESETNGTESDADPISLGKYYTGSTYIPGRGSDYDYYRFYIPQAGKVTIDFLGTTGTDGAYIASLYLYSNQIDYSASWNVYRTVSGAGTTALINAGARTTNLFLPQGTYFLRSYAEDDDKSWGQTYSLRVAHDAGKYEVENNNAQNANNPLSLATTYAASLYRPGWSDDYDYYRFYVPQPSWMSIDFRFPASSAANTQADVYLYNAAGYSLEWSIKGVASNAKMSSLMQSGSKKILKLQHGIYYMRVYGDDDYISWGKEYKFIVATHNITHIDTPQKTVNLAKGRSMTLPVMSYSGNNPLSTYLTWSSTDTYVASVDQNGKVTARNPGKAMIIAKAKNGRILNVTVKVVKKSVALKSAVISGPSVMTVGSLKKLTIRLNPTTATGQNITFKSSNKTGLTVDKAGFVKALKAGTYTVTIKIGTKTYTKNITIR